MNVVTTEWSHDSMTSGDLDQLTLFTEPQYYHLLLLLAAGSTLVHSTCGELLHNISPSSHLTHPHLLRITRNGHLVVHYANQKGCLAVYTCNGSLISQLKLEEPALVQCL